MNEKEFPAPGAGAGINSQMEAERARPLVVRNSRMLIGVTLVGSVFALFLALCMVLMVFSLVFPVADLNADKGWEAVKWAFGACVMGWMCPWLWQMGRAMAGYEVRLDSRGVDFKLGTKKKPQGSFLPGTRWHRSSTSAPATASNTLFPAGTERSEVHVPTLFSVPRRWRA